MKKYLLVLLALTLIFVMAAHPAFASNNDHNLIDGAGLLTEEEGAEIESRLDEVSEKYDYDVAIITVETMPPNADPAAQAEIMFDTYGFGVGNNGGVLLFIAMETRDVVVFYDSVLNVDIAESIRESVTPYLSDGEYAEAFDWFIYDCDYYINGEVNGYPFEFFGTLVISAVIGFIVAFIATAVMKGQLKSVSFRRAAENYVAKGSFALTEARDSFLYSTLTKREKPKDNGKSSSSSSSSSGSRGSSSGKF